MASFPAVGTSWTPPTKHCARRSAPSPPTAGTCRRPAAGWTVAQVFQHAVGDQGGYAAALTGEPGLDFNPFDPSGDMEGVDPVAFLEDALARAAKAWAGIDRDVAEVPTPVPPHELSPWSGSAARGLDTAVHAWDIAMATGRPPPLTPELARSLLKIAREIVEPLRPRGAYVAALVPKQGDDDVAVLLRYLGRDPRRSTSLELSGRSRCRDCACGGGT
ncbi:maleylpyruvate isomerase N-terminal domain-containing protein [Streptomyces sp. NPDC002817]|uniref:maleylpyruvate isomerase N-terminal domain-containing protein n=1 Tax=Streptomyces sp. NPDC088357 TaxID=3154655 RepID=UPI00341AA021